MAEHAATILVVDDDKHEREMLDRSLSSCGYLVRQAASAEEALKALAASRIDLILVDLRIPGTDSLELLRRVGDTRPDVMMIAMAGYASMNSAVEAMQAGAQDYVPKPFDANLLSIRVRRALEQRDTMRENRRLRKALTCPAATGNGVPLIGTSAAMRSVQELVSLVAGNHCNVLIHGETGTGKEVVAKAIHQGGRRRGKPFVALNCGSVSKSLLESQLFGHVKGAFTDAVKDSRGFFAAADGGTIFLDEITEVSTETQARLLRAIQEKEVTPVGSSRPVSFDVRIVAATNRDVREAVDKGLLREDLYYRLAVVVIKLPPLRERSEDIPEFVDYFSTRLATAYGEPPKRASDETMALLKRHSWPGNVRQLENVMERAFALSPGLVIEARDLPAEIRNSSVTAGASDPQAMRVPSALPRFDEAERDLLVRSLEESGGKKAEAARLLGVERKRLYRLLHRHGLMPDDRERRARRAAGAQP